MPEKTRLRLFTPEQRRKLELSEKRAKTLHYFGTAPDGTPWGEYCSARIRESLDFEENATEEEAQEVLDLYKRAHGGDRDAKMELQELRIHTTTNNLLPILNFARFFEVITLADNESPAIQNTTREHFSVTTVGQDGKTTRSRVNPTTNEFLINLEIITTPEVEYPIRDLYRGNIAESYRKTIDLDYDLECQFDGILQTLVLTAFGNFTLTGNKAARAYNAHSRIRSGVLPTSNDISIPGVTTSTKLGQTVFDEITDYAVRFGNDAMGPLQPTGEIIVPADQVKHMGTGVTLTNAAQNAVAQEIAANGWFGIHYLGKDWKLVPDNTIAANRCIAPMNRPLGKLWLKPSMDADEEEIVKKLRIAKRFKQKVYAAAILEQDKKNAARVRYTADS